MQMFWKRQAAAISQSVSDQKDTLCESKEISIFF